MSHFRKGVVTMNTIYGYCRCSTNDKKQDIDRQVKELKEIGATKIRYEYISGTKDNKEQLNQLLDDIKPGDTLAVTEVSRLSRSTKQLCGLIETVKQKRIKLIVKNSITIDCTNGELDAMTKAFLQMAGVFAELEHDMICSRVKSGVANARAKGKQVGRPTLKIDDIPEKVKKYYPMFENGDISKTDYAKMCDISRPTLDKYITVIKGIA